MSVKELRKLNVDEAKDLYEGIANIIESEVVPWVWQKRRADRTKLVLSVISFWRLLRGEYVFFNPKYLEDAIDIWKTLAKVHPEVDEWIKIYEERLKMKKKIGEIGERLVDLSSSQYSIPVCLSMAVEYEPVPNWGSIMVDFRKLLNVLARVKVGIFHLPTGWSTSHVWVQDEETGEIKWESKVLDSNKLDQLVEDVKKEIKPNKLEHPHTVYLTTFVRAQAEKKEVNLYGYLFWRESSGEVHSETLEPKTFRFH